MAIDTTQKKLSLLNYGLPWFTALPEGDGTIDQGDQQHALHLYSGIAFATAVAVGIVSFTTEALGIPGFDTEALGKPSFGSEALGVPGFDTETMATS